MEFKEALERLEKSKEFKIGNEYLAHGFTTLDKDFNQAEPWQIGYYNKEKDRITAFSVTEHVIEKGEEQEIFKKPEAEVEKLDSKKVKKEFSEAIEIAKKVKQEKYKAEIPTKTIVLIQNIADIGTVWNITMVTASLNTLNLKINAENGDVIEEKLTNLLQYREE